MKTEWADARGERFDIIGSVIYSLMLVLIMVGVSESFPIPVISGLVLLIVFILWENRVGTPHSRNKAFQTKHGMLMGLGFALFSSPNTNAIMGSVDKRFYGLASATLATMRVVGQMLQHGHRYARLCDLYSKGHDYSRSLSPAGKEHTHILCHFLTAMLLWNICVSCERKGEVACYELG